MPGTAPYLHDQIYFSFSPAPVRLTALTIAPRMERTLDAPPRRLTSIASELRLSADKPLI